MTLWRLAALKRTALFGSLAETALAEIAECAKELHRARGEMLFLAGEDARGLFIVVAGKVRVFQHSPAGREQVMYVHSDGAVIAEVPVFDDGPYPASAACETDVDVLFLTKSNMQEFCTKYPPLALKALRIMAQRVRRHAQLIEALSFHEVRQRLALFLLAEAQRANAASEQRIVFSLTLSNHQVADRIGSVRDVVARAFARLKHEGLIELKGRMLIIPDADALKRYGMNDRGTSAHPSALKKSA